MEDTVAEVVEQTEALMDFITDYVPIGTLTPIQTLPIMARRKVDPLSSIKCLECGNVFLAITGVTYPTHYILNGAVEYGCITFDCMACVLKYLPDSEVGHG